MAYYVGETYTREQNGQTYTVKIQVDDCPDTSYLGEYTDRGDTFCVWRQDGTLRGDYPDEPTFPDATEIFDDPGSDWADSAYDGIDDIFDYVFCDWQNAEPEILAEYLSRGNLREYAYFIPYAGGLDPEDPNTDLAEWAKYAQQDYERMESLNRGDWGYVGIVVSVVAPACPTCKHTEELYSSLWGIESDCDDSDYEEIIAACIADLTAELAKFEAVTA